MRSPAPETGLSPCVGNVAYSQTYRGRDSRLNTVFFMKKGCTRTPGWLPRAPSPSALLECCTRKARIFTNFETERGAKGRLSIGVEAGRMGIQVYSSITRNIHIVYTNEILNDRASR
jgi:hypothetical protein